MTIMTSVNTEKVFMRIVDRFALKLENNDNVARANLIRGSVSGESRFSGTLRENAKDQGSQRSFGLKWFPAS